MAPVTASVPTRVIRSTALEPVSLVSATFGAAGTTLRDPVDHGVGVAARRRRPSSDSPPSGKREGRRRAIRVDELERRNTFEINDMATLPGVILGGCASWGI